MNDGNLEERLRRLEDRLELEDLVVRYSVAIDDQDFEALNDIYATDAVAEGSPPVRGREKVVDALRVARSNLGVTIHTPDFLLLDFESETAATGTQGAHLELAMGGEAVFGAMRYLDRYKKEDGRWWIVSREQKFFYVTPWQGLRDTLLSSSRIRWPGAEPAAAHLGPSGLEAVRDDD